MPILLLSWIMWGVITTMTSFFSFVALSAPNRFPRKGISLSPGILLLVSSFCFETSPPMIIGVLFGTRAKVCTRLVDVPGLLAITFPSLL